jgi:hypothetical protein
LAVKIFGRNLPGKTLLFCYALLFRSNLRGNTKGSAARTSNIDGDEVVGRNGHFPILVRVGSQRAGSGLANGQSSGRD